jgi:hypothetical protein
VAFSGDAVFSNHPERRIGEMKTFFLFAALFAMVGVAGAQNYIAHPMDCLHGYQGQIIPLGASTSTSFDESRTQHLIPAHYLPSPGAYITELEVSPHVTGSVPYKQLVISLGHTSASSLTTGYATNLPSPTVVLAIKNLVQNFSSTTLWYPIQFNMPFQYDGQSNLIVEIQKEIDRTANPSTVSHQTTNYPTRNDLPRPLFAYGAGGSGQFNATTGSLFSNGSHLMMRLKFRAVPTTSISSTRPASSSSYFRLSSTVTVTVQANPNDVHFNAIDFAVRPSPAVLPGVHGGFWLQTFVNLYWTGIVPASGRSNVSITIPNVATLIGTQVYFQSAVASPSSIDFTNVVDCIIQA